MAAYPETATPLLALAQAVLRGPSPLSEGERELLAVAVSVQNDCAFCSKSHAAAARILLGPRAHWIDAILARELPDDFPPKLEALLGLALSVGRSGHEVDSEIVTAARTAGATDKEIHDAVLVAATFSLYNRYVDGLGAPEPADSAAYASMGQRLVRNGYI